MKPLFTLEGSSVRYDGREELRYGEVRWAVCYGLRRKLRLAGYDLVFWKTLRESGEAELSWNFTRHNRKSANAWVTFHAWETEVDCYHLHCVGPQAEYVIERINQIAVSRVPKRVKRALARINHTRKRRNKLAKKRRQREARAPNQLPKLKTRRAFTPAPISLERNEILTPQFRNHRISWHEARKLVADIFQVRSNWKYTKDQLVAQELWGSLERSGYRFASYKRDGFVLRFDLIDGVYRGDITPLTVSCTKDNAYPVYRRLRKRLREKLHGLTPEEHLKRRVLLWYDNTRAVA